MKELEKVKRISVGSTLFILAVLVGVATYELPENTYAVNTSTALEDLTSNDYIVSMDDIEDKDVALVDIRSPYEYNKGHLENAINISTPDILEEENQKIFEELKDQNRMAVLYGKDIEEANIPFMVLYQMGYQNLKLLSVKNSYSQNNLITQPAEIEKPVADIQEFIKESVKNSNREAEVQERPVVPKKIIPVQKKKKKPVEGGC